MFVQMTEIDLQQNSQKIEVTKIYVVLNKCEILDISPTQIRVKGNQLLHCKIYISEAICIYLNVILVYHSTLNILHFFIFSL